MHKCIYTSIDTWETITWGPYIVIIAGNCCQRKQGMQGTSHLPKNTLMLFSGVSPGTYFHTHNCIPLDIVPISSEGEILDIWTADSNKNKIGPAPYFTSNILESPARWFKSQNLRRGDYVTLLNI